MEIIGSYELTKRLGSGTFGTVWLAKNRATGWLRAIKFANDPDVVHQFKMEAATLDRLKHPRIVQVHEFIDDPDRPGIIFEYIEGGDLSQRLKDGPLPWQEAVRIALETLDALQAAHEAGLIHRDIKPPNILLTDEGHVKVADFGLVSAAERAGSVQFSRQEDETSTIAGTAHYMAPEYDEGAKPSPQADLFSLGVVLYQCLTGRLPRGFARPPSQLVEDCPESLDDAVMALLEVYPEDRPASAAEAQELLAQAAQGDQATRPQSPVRQKAPQRQGRVRQPRQAPSFALLKPDFRVGDETTGPDGGTYVWVPPGEFMMGSEDSHDHERPVHSVHITKGVWLGKHAVTNAQYKAFCEATGREFPPNSDQGDDHPVVDLNWQDALAYCDHYGLALPTEAQWEYAARGPEGRTYPWGDEWDGTKCCHRGNKGPGGKTHPVGSFPEGASWCHALNMSGNVWEWCADWYDADYYGQSAESDPAGPTSGVGRILRGGSWGSVVPRFFRCASRTFSYFPRARGDDVGFRCARGPTG